jgi:UDP-N-acetylglucosamine--N-acetylmuramyl-(pentapeptide) pyrophosphoryl-undecaprenol N-acetylglucosamine transferase
MIKNSLKVIISGGGTGGHIFPAIAIANAIIKIDPSAEILFVGAKGRMEMEKVPEAGYEIIGLNISGFQRRITWKNLTFPFKVISSLLGAKKIIKQFGPDVVVGVGGYASGPVLRIASRRKIPTLIQEQNSYPGITNKILSKRVNCICVAYQGMEKFFPADKIILTGNPVRLDITELNGKRENGLEMFGLKPEKKTVLVIGGSLGARTINESIVKDLDLLRNNNVQLIWQTGRFFYGTALVACEKTKEFGIFPYTFIARMDLAYAAADVIISRAGAIAISELCLVGKPVILVPSPNVSEDHQTKNALALTGNEAAVLIKDIDAREVLVKTVVGLTKDPEKCELLQNNIIRFAHKNAAEKIADIIINLVKKD